MFADKWRLKFAFVLFVAAAALAGLSQRAIEALGQALDVLAAQAGANVADFITLDDEGWRLDLESASDDGLLHLVKKLYKEKDGSDGLELYSAQSASDKLGRLALTILDERRQSAELDDLTERIARLEEVNYPPQAAGLVPDL